MRKLIDIDDDIFKQIQLLAVQSDNDPKNYIQDIIIEHVKKERIKINARRRYYTKKATKL